MTFFNSFASRYGTPFQQSMPFRLSNIESRVHNVGQTAQRSYDQAMTASYSIINLMSQMQRTYELAAATDRDLNAQVKSNRASLENLQKSQLADAQQVDPRVTIRKSQQKQTRQKRAGLSNVSTDLGTEEKLSNRSLLGSAT